MDTRDIVVMKRRSGPVMSLKLKMSRRKGDDMETAEPHFRGKCQTALKIEDIEEGMNESIKKMYNSFIAYQRQGSNWTVDKVVDVTIHMVRYRPLRESSYIPLPIKLRSKHAITNVSCGQSLPLCIQEIITPTEFASIRPMQQSSILMEYLSQ